MVHNGGYLTKWYGTEEFVCKTLETICWLKVFKLRFVFMTYFWENLGWQISCWWVITYVQCQKGWFQWISSSASCFFAAGMVASEVFMGWFQYLHFQKKFNEIQRLFWKIAFLCFSLRGRLSRCCRGVLHAPWRRERGKGFGCTWGRCGELRVCLVFKAV